MTKSTGKTMYKLTHKGKCVMLAPLRDCFDHLKELVGHAPAYELRKQGWSIDPARKGTISAALDAVSRA